MAWINPTGFEDPETAWDDETNVYDDNESTQAIRSLVSPFTWSEYLHVTCDAHLCHKVRIKPYYHISIQKQINLDIWDSVEEEWVDVYTGYYDDGNWLEKVFPPRTITKARMSFRNYGGAAQHMRVYEFDFWEGAIVGWPPQKNADFLLVFSIYGNDGDLVTGATALDSEISKDGNTFTDCTYEAVESESSGIYQLILTSDEMDADVITIITKTSTEDAKTAINIIYTSINQIDTLDAIVDTIAAKTDNLPADPADDSEVKAEIQKAGVRIG